jgi:hypothetical protein
MTLPVFSDTEVRNIRATKKVCSQCKGVRRVVINVPTNMYRCGYYTAAVLCTLCGGTGLTDHITVADQKTAAAGEEAQAV